MVTLIWCCCKTLKKSHERAKWQKSLRRSQLYLRVDKQSLEWSRIQKGIWLWCIVYSSKCFHTQWHFWWIDVDSKTVDISLEGKSAKETLNRSEQSMRNKIIIMYAKWHKEEDLMLGGTEEISPEMGRLVALWVECFANFEEAQAICLWRNTF